MRVASDWTGGRAGARTVPQLKALRALQIWMMYVWRRASPRLTCVQPLVVFVIHSSSIISLSTTLISVTCGSKNALHKSKRVVAKRDT